MKVLILGASGMLGNAVYRAFSSAPQHEAWGTSRTTTGPDRFPTGDRSRLIAGVEVRDWQTVVSVVRRVEPDVVVNAVGIIKQLPIANDPLVVLPINAEFPHRLATLCDSTGVRMIQLSSDCVYSGRKGNYVESDPPDAEDLYGRSKHLGEVTGAAHVVTLRTSGIGHELGTRNGLVEWFLSQQGRAKGYAKAIYSGLPTVELARVIRDVVVARPELSGLYHVSARAISKLDLLTLIARAYGKAIAIEPEDTLQVDRSLNSERFRLATGYAAADWPELIQQMHDNRV